MEALDNAKIAAIASEDKRAKLEAELAKTRADIAAIKAANVAKADTHDYDEAATRDTFIDLSVR